MSRLVALLACLTVNRATGIKVQGFFTDAKYDAPAMPCDGSLCGFFEGKRVISTDSNGTVQVLGIDNDNVVWAARGKQAVSTFAVPEPTSFSVNFTYISKDLPTHTAKFTAAGGIALDNGEKWTPVAASDVPPLEIATDGVSDTFEDMTFNGVWEDEITGERRFVTDRIGKRRGTAITFLGFTDPGYWGRCMPLSLGTLACKFGDGSRKNAMVKATTISFTDGEVWRRMQVKQAPQNPEL